MGANYKYAATCLFGLEGLVGADIDALGCKRTGGIDGRVYFEGGADAAARANINMRYAERLYLVLGEFPARSFDELFEGVAALPLEDVIPRDGAFPVKGHCLKSGLQSVPDCQSIVKKAAAKRLGAAYSLTTLPETGEKYQLVFFIYKDTASILLDLSGDPLYKRGYRRETGEAPIRETLAAALATFARPRSDVLFWDPMCGSGTIPIEAALLMTHTAPGLNRSFAAERFGIFPSELWDDARDEAVAAIDEDCGFEAFASDIDPAAVAQTRDNVRRAGMAAHIKCFEADALKIEAGGRRGTIVCNPPYGERMSTVEESEALYRAMGAHFATLDRWQIYVITSSEKFAQLYGRRADKIRKLYNGMIPCYFYEFFKPPRN